MVGGGGWGAKILKSGTMFESDTKSISRKILKENDTVTNKIEAKFLEVRHTVNGHDHSERNITLKKKNLNEIRNVQKETWGEGAYRDMLWIKMKQYLKQ